MKIEWQIFDSVEVQVFKPESPSQSAILFCPGFPGAGATIFEQRHAGALVEEGYTVFVIHHKGTRLTNGFSPFMVNNSARMQKAYKTNQTHLGNGLADIAEWMVEPLHVLKAIGKQFESIHVIGNSYGAISALWSLTEEAVPLDHVKSVLLYAGAQATIDNMAENSVMRYWTDEAPNLPHVIQKIEFDPAKPFASVIYDVHKALPERIKARLPDRISITYLVVEKDEVIPLSDTENFKAAIGGRGKIVMDTIDHAWQEAFLMAHDTPNYRTSDLVALIRG